MAFSPETVDRLAAAMSEDFNVFLQTERFDELSELFADAANDFITRELGGVDDVLFYDLALALMARVHIN